MNYSVDMRPTWSTDKSSRREKVPPRPRDRVGRGDRLHYVRDERLDVADRIAGRRVARRDRPTSSRSSPESSRTEREEPQERYTTPSVKEELFTLVNLGQLSMEDIQRGDLFWRSANAPQDLRR